MQILKLDHVNIRTTRLERMVEWYETVLGLRRGPRPNFSFKGAWLYAGEQAVVHIIQVPDDNIMGSEVSLKLEHFAFSADGLLEFETKLKRLNIEYRRSAIAELGLVQINIWDVDGNHIHVDFKDAV